MKFWQLVSITSDEADLIARIALVCPVWKKYELLARNFPASVKSQDRAALDTSVDTDFVIEVLGGMKKRLYLSSDNWLRSWQLDPTDQIMSVLDSVTRYGADVVEAVCERGAVEVKPQGQTGTAPASNAHRDTH